MSAIHIPAGAGAGAAVAAGGLAAAVPLLASLTPLERAYCRGRRHPAQHVAGRLAAKRAVATLLGRAGWGAVDEAAIEVVPAVPPFPVALGWQPSYQPVCRAVGGESALAAALTAVRVSISHTGDLAVAAAITIAPNQGACT